MLALGSLFTFCFCFSVMGALIALKLTTGLAAGSLGLVVVLGVALRFYRKTLD